MTFLKKEVGFGTVKYALMYIPTYPCGSIGTLMCTKKTNANLTNPVRSVESLGFASELKYYSTDMHKAAFVLPAFASYLNKD